MERRNHIPLKAEKTCSACGKPYSPLRLGRCQPCYRRYARYGSTEYKREEIEDITVGFVLKNCKESGGCLLWTGTVSKEGTPQTTDRRLWREEGKSRQIRLHRWMYEHHAGVELRKGQQVKQTCGNKLCLSPAHLSIAKGRSGRTPLGEAGQYKGRRKREDGLERCANGHKWTGENLYIDPKGRRICRICQVASYLRRRGKDPDAHEWRRRRSWEESPECANGHVYEEVGWYFNGEARVCRRCFAEKERQRWLRVNYGLALEDFEALLVGQDFACAICSATFDPGVRDLTPCVDHSHSDGSIRGLLCHACNLGLGHFKDSPERLHAALEYLKALTPKTTPRPDGAPGQPRTGQGT
ncbi:MULTISPECIES: endonuclease VII domain-containing protein [unclassified Streptomyces]|uniref:endonuclease VII domain-containing protein n=1 Tax=unclassified Streptomyces TaxID=2593676 RepID=UPI0018D94C25|nr:endonuclease VII domain-containing protein [Streptomyces sp. HB-N217]MBH5129508.1 endonuclease VII domain-containing protein [Streptomyces sp. HB-N217]